MADAAPGILLIDDDPGCTQALAADASACGYAVEVASSLAGARALIQVMSPDLTLVDIRLPDGSGLELLQELTPEERARLVIMTGDPSADTAALARRHGVLDYVVKPLSVGIVQRLLHDADELARSLARPGPSAPAGALQRWGDMLSAAPAMLHQFAMLERLAPSAHTVLLQGESGCGKELAARAIHHYSGRSGSFVAINCGALTTDLAGSQLFGHERGSFTGAVAAHRGAFEQAQHGTLFLDEFIEMPAAAQTYLLRVLEEREVTPLGSARPRPVDVRVLAACNGDPLQAIASGRLRRDLYYRLAELIVLLPPLRERPQDIDLLAQHFLRQLSVEHGRPYRMSPASRQRLKAHAWPGNVRELRHVMTRAAVLAQGLELELDLQPGAEAMVPPPAAAGGTPGHVGERLDQIERRAILGALEHYGDQAQAAAALGISVKTIYNKLLRYRQLPAAGEA